MTNQKRLSKAIEKAVVNGWNTLEYDPEIHRLHIHEFGADIINEETEVYDFEQTVNDIIFSPSFAKAYWGEEEYCEDCKSPCQGKGQGCMGRICKIWEYHQHKMLDELQAGRSPIKYLEKFL